MADFFPLRKRHTTFEHIDIKLNNENERRIRLDFLMPLDEDNLQGAPQQVVNAFATVSNPNNGITELKIASEFEWQIIKFFPTPTSPEAIRIENATVRGLVMRRDPKKDNGRTVTLEYETTVPYNSKLWAWGGENKGMATFVVFEEGQAEMNLTAKPDRKKKAAHDEEEVVA